MEFGVETYVGDVISDRQQDILNDPGRAAEILGPLPPPDLDAKRVDRIRMLNRAADQRSILVGVLFSLALPDALDLIIGATKDLLLTVEPMSLPRQFRPMRFEEAKLPQSDRSFWQQLNRIFMTPLKRVVQNVRSPLHPHHPTWKLLVERTILHQEHFDAVYRDPDTGEYQYPFSGDRVARARSKKHAHGVGAGLQTIPQMLGAFYVDAIAANVMILGIVQQSGARATSFHHLQVMALSHRTQVVDMASTSRITDRDAWEAPTLVEGDNGQAAWGGTATVMNGNAARPKRCGGVRRIGDHSLNDRDPGLVDLPSDWTFGVTLSSVEVFYLAATLIAPTTIWRGLAGAKPHLLDSDPRSERLSNLLAIEPTVANDDVTPILTRSLTDAN